MPSLRSESDLAQAQAYRAGQLTLRARFLRDSLALWPVLDKARIGETSPSWLRLQADLIRRWRTESATAAGRYYRLVGGREAPSIPDLPDDQITRSLLHTGPAGIDRALRSGLKLVEADSTAQVMAAQSGARLALSGGRDTLDAAVKAHKVALGWMRVTDDDPCAFCAMLASRGPVYKSAKSAGKDPRGSVNRYHDGCGCQVVPVFTRDAALPESSQRFSDLWATSTRGLSGTDAINAFRRAVEGRSKADDPINRVRRAA